jgi:flavin-dependent dehydrogenase
VEIRGGCKFVNMEAAPEGAAVTIRDIHNDCLETFTARTIIGADGSFSRVGKIANCNGHQTTPILQAIVSLPDHVHPNTTQVWFEPEDTPYFYWLIPESEKQAAVGFIAEEGKSARARLERFLKRQRLELLDMQAARIPAYAHSIRPWRRMYGADIYLIGDAAAQVKVTTVGGLVTGLRGARAAANAILRRTDYLKELKPLRRELGLHLLLRVVLNRFGSKDYDRLLGLLNKRTIQMLGRFNRDNAVKVLCRLVLTQPRFLIMSTVFLKSTRPRFQN